MFGNTLRLQPRALRSIPRASNAIFYSTRSLSAFTQNPTLPKTLPTKLNIARCAHTRAPLQEEQPSKKLYVPRLPSNISEERIDRVFAPFGPLKEIRIPRNDDGKILGYAFVEFENIEHAIAAWEQHKMAPKFWNGGGKIQINYFKEQKQKQKPKSPLTIHPPSDRLFVNGFSLDTTEEDLEKVFSAYGPVSDVYIARHENGTSRGFGRVDFEKTEDAVAALTKHITESPIVIHNRKLYLEYRANETRYKPEVPPSNILHLFKLPLGTSEEELAKVFSQFGLLNRVFIPRYGNGIPHPEAVIEFTNEKDATAVLERHKTAPLSFGTRKVGLTYFDTLRFDPETLTVRKVLPTKLDTEPPSKRLHIRYIHALTTEQEVEKVFAEFGTIKDVYIPLNDDGTNQGTAYVEFENIEDAVAARERHDIVRFRIGRNKVKVMYSKENRKESSKPKPEVTVQPPSNRLFVNRLSPDTTEEDLENVFSAFGTVNDVHIVRNDDGSSRRFGHVEFETIEDATTALQRHKSSPISVDNRRLHLEYRQVKSSADPPPSNILHLNKLSRGTSQEEIEKVFSQFGPLKRVFLPRYGDGTSRTHAVVEFANEQDAVSLIEKQNTEPLSIGNRKVGLGFFDFVHFDPETLTKREVESPTTDA